MLIGRPHRQGEKNEEKCEKENKKERIEIE